MTKPTDPSAPDEQVSYLNLSYLVTLVLRRQWLIAVSFLTIFLMSVGYVLKAGHIYESTAVVQVEQQEQRVFNANDGDDQGRDLRSEDILNTIAQNLQSPDLFESVVRDPEISSDPQFRASFVNAGEKSIAFSELATRLLYDTKVTLRARTRLIDIRVDNPYPQLAQKLAQKIVDQFIAQNAETQTNATKAAMQALIQESDRMKDNLQKSEDSLQIYKEALLLKDRIDDQQRVIDALEQRYRAKHPEMIQARALMADLMQNFDGEIKKVLANSKTEATYWSENDEGAMASPSVDIRIATELKLVEARANVLQREVDTESALFENVLKQMREADVSKESAPTQITLVGPPELPLKPTYPKKGVVLALGMFGGLAFGLGLVFLLDLLDSSIKTAAEAEEFLKLPVLGAIPLIVTTKEQRRKEKKTGAAADVKEQHLVMVTEPGGEAAESLRSLRASLSLLGKVEDRRTILFTSAFADEGKTFVSSNYAVSLAQQGLSTLLIDTDLRRPAAHTAFHLENTVGLVEHITQGSRLAEVVQHGTVENLDVLTSGSRCPNPAELLSGTGFAETLREALAIYDRVVIDSSPVNLVSDSLLVAPYVQTICLVTRTARTPRRAVEHAVRLLERADAKPVGLILNFVPIWSGQLSYAPYGYKARDYSHYRNVYSSQG
jgi:capsular exopolysaccharide synthesis family protein